MYTAKIIPFNYAGEFVWQNKPYTFYDLKNDLPNVACLASKQIPDYENASYDIDYMRKIICYVHQVINSEISIKRFRFEDEQIGWVKYAPGY